MNHPSFDDQAENNPVPVANGGLSRRRTLKLLAQGMLGGLLLEATQIVPSAQAQSAPTFLPFVGPGLSPSPDDDDDDDLETAAIDFSWFRTHLVE